jgi:hypothetical protein
MKKESVFELYSYSQQANSLKMSINAIVPAVQAHVRNGRLNGKKNVEDYPRKVARQLQLIIQKLNNNAAR